MRSEVVVIALGGNAINKENQAQAIERSCAQIAEIIDEYRVVITHGNGPQVGDILIQQELASKEVPPMPLEVCVAMTQGQIGYLIQQKLSVRGVPVASVITQVVVDEDDPAFKEPTKPIGPLYSKDRAKELLKEGYHLKGVSKGLYRRVVPSPKPLAIIEEQFIKTLIEEGYVVIACGGGGIPVTYKNGRLKGVGAVIDKDLSSALLATKIKAHTFLTLTDVEHVALYYGTSKQVNLIKLKLDEAKCYLKEGHFPPGSMGPKVEGAINFLEGGGERAIIAPLSKAKEGLEGKAGTEIVK
jgi:carbamate kinase